MKLSWIIAPLCFSLALLIAALLKTRGRGLSRKRVASEDEMCIAGLGYSIIIIVIAIFIFITDKEARPVLQPVLIGVVILLAIIGVTVLAIYLPNRNKRRRMHLERIDAIEAGDDTESIPELTEDVLDRPTVQERSSRRVVKKKKKLVLNYRRKKLVFKGKITDEKCPICKLDLRVDQEILACPQCKTPFHEGHLIQWISTENSCPVCGEAYAIIDREKKIRTRKE